MSREVLIANVFNAVTEQELAAAIAELIIANNPRYAALRPALVAALTGVLTGATAVPTLLQRVLGWFRR